MAPSAVGQTTVWVGLDIHEDTIVVAAAAGTDEPRHVGTVANDSNSTHRGSAFLDCNHHNGPCGRLATSADFHMATRIGWQKSIRIANTIERRVSTQLLTAAEAG